MKPASFMQIYNKEILKAFTLILPIFPQLQKQITATTTAEMKLTVTAFLKTLFLEKL